MTESLPGFARDWMAQWRRAAEQLSRIRDAQLRQLQPADELDAISLLDFSSRPVVNPHENGLVIQQKWFMRQRLLQMATKESNLDGPAQASSIGD